jgi:hypothetical protein
MFVNRPPLLLAVILMALVQSICAARGSPDSSMSGEVANNSSDNRALNATARPGVRWVNDYNGYQESHYRKPVLHGDLLP